MSALHVSVATKEQLSALTKSGVVPARIYADAVCVLSADKGALLHRKKLGVPDEVPVYIALPFITRQERGTCDMPDLQTVVLQAYDAGYGGLLVRNAEQLGYLATLDRAPRAVTDYGIYIWNPEAWHALLETEGLHRTLTEYCLPYELRLSEQEGVADAIGKEISCAVCVYGRIPMMVSAECVRMNTVGCTGRRGETETAHTVLSDRTGRKLPVTCHCRYCYNVIWNAYPLSLHGFLPRIGRDLPQAACRVDLTCESADEAHDVITFFAACMADNNADAQPPYAAYTTGRIGKGVE